MGLVLWDRAARHDHRSASDGKTWVDREVAECEFRDARLGKRFRILLERIGSAMGKSIVACDLGAFRRQMKVGFYACDRCRCQELAIGMRIVLNEFLQSASNPAVYAAG